MFLELKGDGTVAIIRLLIIFLLPCLDWITKEMVFLVLDLILSGGISCFRYTLGSPSTTS